MHKGEGRSVGHPMGPWKKVREGLDHRQHKKASTFGRFKTLRGAHLARGCSVASDGAILGVKSPTKYVDSTSLKPARLTFRTHAKKIHWGDGLLRNGSTIWDSGS
eukprot:5850546-Prymnesium_polylepis.1